MLRWAIHFRKARGPLDLRRRGTQKRRIQLWNPIPPVKRQRNRKRRFSCLALCSSQKPQIYIEPFLFDSSVKCTGQDRIKLWRDFLRKRKFTQRKQLPVSRPIPWKFIRRFKQRQRFCRDSSNNSNKSGGVQVQGFLEIRDGEFPETDPTWSDGCCR